MLVWHTQMFAFEGVHVCMYVHVVSQYNMSLTVHTISLLSFIGGGNGLQSLPKI